MTAYSRIPMPCSNCGKLIGRDRHHCMLDDNTVLCGKCFDDEDGALHTKLYPDCPAKWHDLYDHNNVRLASRAAAHRIINQDWGFK